MIQNKSVSCDYNYFHFQTMKGKNNGKSWKDSLAKRLLENDLKMGIIPLSSEEMGPREVYIHRPEFSEFPYTNFQSNLRSLRKTIQEKHNSSEYDAAAILHDRQIHPKAVVNRNGKQRWEGSDAEFLLRQDIDNKFHLVMEPNALYNTRHEYKDNFSLTVFRKHIDQEVRRRKFISYLEDKDTKNKKKRFENQDNYLNTF
jgi:hypothetical protein